MQHAHQGQFEPMQFDLMTYHAMIKRQLVAAVMVLTSLVTYAQLQDDCRRTSAMNWQRFGQPNLVTLGDYCSSIVCALVNPLR